MEREEDIQTELNKRAPLLAALPRKHPFTVPENYFASAAQPVLEKIREGGSRHKIADFKNIEHPFEHPANYFDELPATILSKIKTRSAERHRQSLFPIGSFLSKEYRLIAAAVAVILVIAAIAVLQQVPVRTNMQVTTQENMDETNLILQVAEVDEEVIVNLYLEDQTLDKASIADPVLSGPALLDVTDIDDEYFDDI